MKRTSESHGFSPEKGRSGRMQNGAHSPQKSSRSETDEGGLRLLFVAELKDIYWAEKALVKALPKMAAKATSSELVDAITAHLEVTEGHVSRLEQVFEAIGEKAQGKKCDAMAGLIEEGEYVVDEMPEGDVRDAAIIASAQKVEHYEIAAYGTLCAFAKTLGETEAGELLHQILEEEKEADETLTAIAEAAVNDGAAGNEAGFTASESGLSAKKDASESAFTAKKGAEESEEYESEEEEDEEAEGKEGEITPAAKKGTEETEEYESEDEEDEETVGEGKEEGITPEAKKGPEHWGKDSKKDGKIRTHTSSLKESKNWNEDRGIGGEEEAGWEDREAEGNEEEAIDSPARMKTKEVVDEGETEDEYTARTEGKMKIEDNEGLVDEPLEDDLSDASPGIKSRRGTGSPDDENAER